MSASSLVRLVAGVVIASWSLAARAQLAGGGAPDIDYLRVAVALVFCLLLGVGVVVLLRRFSFRNLKHGGSAITVVGVVPLARGSTLYVVEFDGRRLLIGAGASGLRTLAEAGTAAPRTDAQ